MKRYCEVSVTSIVRVSVPDVAEIVNCDVPGDVALEPVVAQPCSSPISTTSEIVTIAECVLSRGVLRISTPAYTPPRSAISHSPSVTGDNFHDGIPVDELGFAAAEAALVSVRVDDAAFPLGVTVFGLKDAVTFAGNPVTPNDTKLANPSAVGVTLI